MNHLIVDPGDKNGFCVIKIDGENVEILEYGFFDVKKTSVYLADLCLSLEKWVKAKIKEWNIVEVAREVYFFSRSYATGSKKNVHYRAAIDRAARKSNLHYEILNISSWKVFICGRTTPTKEQLKQYGKREAKKYMIQESLWETYGIKFPNYTMNGKRKIKFRNDIIDAVAMAIYYACKIKNCKTVKCDIECPKDIDWGNKKVSIFVYANIKKKYKCGYVFKSGPRKGVKCFKVSYEVMCKTHINKKEIKCGYIYKRGDKKGRLCEKLSASKMCSLHRRKPKMKVEN